MPLTRVTRGRGRHGADARPGPDLRQPRHPESAACRSARRRRPRARRCSTQAAKRLGAEPRDLDVDGRRGRSQPAGRRVSYGELIGGKSFRSEARPRSRRSSRPEDYTIVGKPCRASTSRTRSPAVHLHAGLPRARHAAWPRRPAAGDRRQARRASTKRSVKDIPGVVKVVREGNFLGVVARERMGRDQGGAAAQGDLVELGRPARAGEALGARARHQGRQGRGHQQCRQRRRGHGQGRREEAQAPPTTSPSTPTARSGPSCAVAEFKDGKLTFWSASQATHNLRKQLATMFDLPPDNVRCIYVEGSGCYGRNGHEDAAADAALLAKAVGPAGARAMVARRRAWLGPERPADAGRPARDAGRAGQRDGLGIGVLHPASGRRASTCRWWRRRSPACRRESRIAPGNIFQNSAIPYKFANIKTVCHRLETTPFRPSWIRTPGRMQNTFANECFMDELAAAAGADPIEFRLKYLDPADTRGIEVLNRVAALAKWEKRPSPQRRRRAATSSRGRGVSLLQIRAGAHLRRRRRRGRGRTARPARSACRSSIVHARLRADHQSGRR